MRRRHLRGPWPLPPRRPYSRGNDCTRTCTGGIAMNLVRIFRLSGAYDLTSPNPHENYGINPMRMYFGVKGPKGGVSATISTAWYLPQNQRESFSMYSKGYPF